MKSCLLQRLWTTKKSGILEKLDCGSLLLYKSHFMGKAKRRLLDRIFTTGLHREEVGRYNSRKLLKNSHGPKVAKFLKSSKTLFFCNIGEGILEAKKSS